MFSTLLKWLRPRSIERALVIRERLALVYAVVGMHVFIYGLYLFTKEDLPFDPEERSMVIDNSNIVRFVYNIAHHKYFLQKRK